MSGMTMDPGLQPQRTALAWRRTAFAMFVNALLTIRSAANSGSRELFAMAALLAAASAALAFVGWWRQRVLLREAVPRSPSALLMLSAGCCAGMASGAGAIGLLV